MIIDGKKIISKKVFNVINPFTKTIVGKAIDASHKHIRQAVEKSYNFQCLLSSKERSKILSKTRNQLRRKKKYYAKIITSESGLSFKDSIYEIDRVINCANYSIKACKIIDRDITSDFVFDKRNQPKLKVITEPLDLVVAITPFNHPMNLVAHKIFPAIVAGTSVVLKPSEKTPLSAVKLVKILHNNGMPPNMVNVVTGKNGKNVLNKILSYSKLDLLTVTGGLKAGLDIKKSLVKKGHSLKKYIPELGGCSSLIVCSDADLVKAAKIILNGCFKNSGQRCTSIRRVIVDKEIVDKLIHILLRKVNKIKYGNPFQRNIDLGTVIDEEAAIKIQKKIKSAIKNGAKLLYGNIRKGALLSPTILDKVKVDMDLVATETFGPVCPIIRSNNFGEALKIAKKTGYMLAGAIVTNDKSKAEKACKYLKVGQFSFNGPPGYRTEVAPFGGFGNSGNGEKEGILLAAKSMRRIRTFYKH